jgi:hypothetical protein
VEKVERGERSTSNLIGEDNNWAATVNDVGGVRELPPRHTLYRLRKEVRIMKRITLLPERTETAAVSLQ